MPTCSECRYWDRRGDNADGECRVRAPVFNEVTRQGMWPWTKPDDWCGEFKARVVFDPAVHGVKRLERETPTTHQPEEGG